MPLNFHIEDLNLLAIEGAPSALSFDWDIFDIPIDFAYAFAPGIPYVNAGFTAYAYGYVNLNARLNLGIGGVDVDYAFETPEFVQTTFHNTDPTLSTSLIFAGGALTPEVMDLSTAGFSLDFNYELHAGFDNARLLLRPPWPFPDADLYGPANIVLVDIAPTTLNLFNLSVGNDTIDFNQFAEYGFTASLSLPELVQNWEPTHIEGAANAPTLVTEGDADPFFVAQLDIVKLIGSFYTPVKALSGSFPIIPGTLNLDYTLLSIAAEANLRASQELQFTPGGVAVEVTTSLGQHVSGMLGDNFVFETPQGEGDITVTATYTLHGTFASIAGFKLGGLINISALEAHLHNSFIYDFGFDIGPIVSINLPSDDGFVSDRIDIYSNFMDVTFAPITVTYTLHYENDVAGSPGPDNLTLTSGQLKVDGGGGDDVIIGNSLDNELIGNYGNDKIMGGTGNDFLSGGAGNDHLIGENGDDELDGDFGDDILEGGNGNDVLTAGGGKDSLQGSAGNDELRSFEMDAADTLNGGTGIDKLVIRRTGETADITFSLAAAFATLPDGTTILGFEQVDFTAGFGDDTLTGGKRDDRLLGGAGNDTLDGGGGGDFVNGDGGNDTVIYVQDNSPDLLFGGAGMDLLVYRGASNASPVFLDMTHAGVQTVGGATFSQFERIDFDAGSGKDDDVVIGGNYDDEIRSGKGSDTLVGMNGKDTLVGGSGNDFFFVGDDGGDVIHGDSGTDTLIIDHSSSNKTANFEFISNGSQMLANGTIIVGVEQFGFAGGKSADQVTGGAGDDSLSGGAGNDILDGGDGEDYINGGADNDLIYVRKGEGADGIDGGAGIDRLEIDVTNKGNAFDFTLDPDEVATLSDGTTVTNVELITLRAGAGNDTLIGGNYSFAILPPATEAAASTASLEPGTIGVIEPPPGPVVLPPPLGPVPGPTFFHLQGDVLYGGKGNDTLDGRDGHDVLFGQEGNDTLYWSHGGDVLAGGDNADSGGVDRVVFRAADDLPTHITLLAPTETTKLSDGTEIIGVERIVYNGSLMLAALAITGNAFSDHIIGGAGDDELSGGGGNDTLEGGGGEDVLIGGTGADTMIGGADDDTYYVDNTNDEIIETAGGGYDVVHANVNYTLSDNIQDLFLAGAAKKGIGNDIANTIHGNVLGNYLDGKGGNDTIYGGDGKDTLHGGAGADELHGGAGDDTYYVDHEGDDVIEAAGGGYDTVWASTSYELPDNVQDLRLYDDAQDGTGNGIDNKIYGNGLDNLLRGAGGADRLEGGAGDDTLDGGDGNDILDGGTGIDHMIGGAGDDRYYVDDSDDTIDEEPGGGNDTIYARANYEMPDATNILHLLDGAVHGIGSGDNNTIHGNDAGNVLKGAGGNDVLFGGAGADTLTGGSGNDTLNGGADNDTLDGEIGADTMRGAAGDDTYMVDNAGDVVVESLDDGDDLVNAAIDYTLKQNFERLTLVGDAVNGTGNSLDNRIEGNTQDNTLSGMDGADTLLGNLGNDTLLGGGGDDQLDGGDGDDILSGDGVPGRGIARAGNDVLTGGLGSDVFVFVGDFGVDTITDFVGSGRIGGDHIDLQALPDLDSYDTLLTYMSEVDGNVAIDLSAVLGADNLIIIANKTIAELQASDFLL